MRARTDDGWGAVREVDGRSDFKVHVEQQDRDASTANLLKK